MGHGAVCSQMDVRISFRVRQRKDVDLILGQGMLAAGWQAHTLNAPRQVPHRGRRTRHPKRARAYLVTDESVADTAARYADLRPPLDEVSQQAIEENRHAERSRVSPDTVTANASSTDTPNVILWATLLIAPAEGTTVPELIDATGMSRPWIYQHLRDLAERRQVTQVSRGRWRAVTDDIP
jgi:hypothetical protein